MASLIIFLSFGAFMFYVGYHWRRLRHDYNRLSNPSGPQQPPEAIWDGLIRKI